MCRFLPSNLTHADLFGADLSGATLSGAVLAGAVLAGARWPEGELVPEGWRLDTGSG
ncbi:MAG: pentapeptide repeat-containing protein [Streptosporangiaceae bacterium]